ncbi:MAG TPA: hypothetical protein VKT81_13110 [Bryobacteraceae bacterium]|nr:hypothetical protein [Bryobacteraceae bacterium]
MGTHTDFQQQVLGLLAKLKAKKEALQKEYEGKVAEVDREIESVSTTARLLREPPSVLEVRVSESLAVSDGSLMNQLMGKTARQALVLIAEANQGIVRITDAKRLLIGAGVIKKPKHAWGATYTNLMRSPEFEKVSGQAGTFRLVKRQGTFSVAS